MDVIGTCANARAVNPKNSRVIYPQNLYFSQKAGYFLTYYIVPVCL